MINSNISRLLVAEPIVRFAPAAVATFQIWNSELQVAGATGYHPNLSVPKLAMLVHISQLKRVRKQSEGSVENQDNPVED